jgi:hypothetical protein
VRLSQQVIGHLEAQKYEGKVAKMRDNSAGHPPIRTILAVTCTFCGASLRAFFRACLRAKNVRHPSLALTVSVDDAAHYVHGATSGGSDRVFEPSTHHLQHHQGVGFQCVLVCALHGVESDFVLVAWRGVQRLAEIMTVV